MHRLLLLTAAVLVVGVVSADVPHQINYQGYLTDPEGVPVPDGNYSVTFRIYGDSVVGASLWEEGQLVTAQTGLFSAVLGSIVAIEEGIFAEPDRWLGIQVGLDPELAPRTRINSAAYAQHAFAADSAVLATTSLDKTVDASDLVSGALDTARFSAYTDLSAEDRIGDQPGQLAEGDHSHTVSALGRIVDDSRVVHRLYDSDSEYEFKSIIIPAGTIGHRLRLKSFWHFSQPGTLSYVRMRLNGEILIEQFNPTGEAILDLEAFMAIGDDSPTTWWAVIDGLETPTSILSIDTESPMTLSLTCELTMAGYVDVTCCLVYVEFDNAD